VYNIRRNEKRRPVRRRCRPVYDFSSVAVLPDVVEDQGTYAGSKRSIVAIWAHLLRGR
jgi:hypothetical protein